MTSDSARDDGDELPTETPRWSANPGDREASPTFRVTVVESQDGTAWTTPLDPASGSGPGPS
jgi:hypothetical protein